MLYLSATESAINPSVDIKFLEIFKSFNINPYCLIYVPMLTQTLSFTSVFVMLMLLRDLFVDIWSQNLQYYTCLILFSFKLNPSNLILFPRAAPNSFMKMFISAFIFSANNVFILQLTSNLLKTDSRFSGESDEH